MNTSIAYFTKWMFIIVLFIKICGSAYIPNKAWSERSEESYSQNATSGDQSTDENYIEGLFRSTIMRNDNNMLYLPAFENINFHAVNSEGLSFLHTAAICDNPDATEMLLKRGIKVDVLCPNMSTSLHYAARRNSLKVLELLLNGEANVNAENKNGETPLCNAVRYNRTAEAVKLLLMSGRRVEVNTRDKDGMTPLLYAARGCNLETVKLLVAAGAHVCIVNDDGHTPLNLARQSENLEVAEFLESYAANSESCICIVS